MTRVLARAVMWLSLLAVVVVAGGHFVYYLLLWEWDRASIAGVGFAASLVVAGSIVILGRLARVEHRLDVLLAAVEAQASAPQGSGTGIPGSDPGVTRTADVEPTPDFPWLAVPTSTFAVAVLGVTAWQAPDQNVFIPVFLAAGIAISGVAGVVERLAAARHRAPVGAGGPATPPSTREVLGTRSSASLVAIAVLGAALAALVVGGLYGTTHYWSKPIGEGTTTMTVEVDSRGPTRGDIQVVEAAGRYCSINTGTGIRFQGVEPAGSAESTLLHVAPLLDDDAQTRLIGCLQDSLLEWHRLTVTDTALTPR